MPVPGAPAPISPSAPSVFRSSGEIAEVVRLEPNSSFRLTFRRDLWEVVTRGLEGPALVPQLKCLWLAPGINGVYGITDKRSREQVLSLASHKVEQQHFQVLDPDLLIPEPCLPRGVKPGGYLRTTPCKGQARINGTRHHEAFVTFEPSFEGPAREIWHMDCRNRWLVHLVAAGAFGEPTKQVLARLGRDAEAAYERALSVPWPQEIRAQRVARAKEPLVALQQAAAGVHGEGGESNAYPPIVQSAQNKGWTYDDLTGSGEGNDWTEKGGRSPRTGLTMAEMAKCSPPPSWAALADTSYPWECEGWRAPRGFKLPSVPSKDNQGE